MQQESNPFGWKIADIKAETFNQLTDTIEAQAKEIRRLEALIETARNGQPIDPDKEMDGATIEITSLIASKNHIGYVGLKWGSHVCQMTVTEARGHAMAILQCAEAAEFDADLFGFALRIAGGDEQEAVPFLVGFRDFRADISCNA